MLRGISFTITLRQKPKRSSAQTALNFKTERESMRVTPSGLCLRVIVNEKPRNLEKTTSSVLSVLLINL